ncbi:MAG: protein translocase subunit SecF [bacterium]
MWIIKHRTIFYIFSAILIVASFVSLAIWGLQVGVDFKGGTVIEMTYPAGRPDKAMVESKIAETAQAISLGNYILRPIGDKDYSIKSRQVNESERQQLQAAFSNAGASAELKKINSIGPVIGGEATKKAVVSVILVILCIVLFITFAFRKVSKPVASWKFGLMAIVALAHDVIIPIGAFSILGHYFGYEVDTLFVTALLVILGFSIHDTIVVYDRIRENLKISDMEKDKKEFVTIVGESVRQTFVRSINTSMSTILALVALYFLGAEATRHFSLALIIGIAVGTYSSIFIASALLVTIQKFQDKKTA